jgi:hypothetical protein
MRAKSDENDENDEPPEIRSDGKKRKAYNITDILSTTSSDFYREQQQQQQFYLHNQLHYDSASAATVSSSSSAFASSSPSEKTKDRYYIYSHTKQTDDDETNNQAHKEAEDEGEEKSRKERSAAPLSDRKRISRNISLVLENLLMSYENSQLPTHGEGLLLASLFVTNDIFIDFSSPFICAEIMFLCLLVFNLQQFLIPTPGNLLLFTLAGI